MKNRGKVAEPGMQSARRPVGAEEGSGALLRGTRRPAQPDSQPPEERLPDNLPVLDRAQAEAEQPTFQEQMDDELAAELKRTGLPPSDPAIQEFLRRMPGWSLI